MTVLDDFPDAVRHICVCGTGCVIHDLALKPYPAYTGGGIQYREALVFAVFHVSLVGKQGEFVKIGSAVPRTEALTVATLVAHISTWMI